MITKIKAKKYKIYLVKAISDIILILNCYRFDIDTLTDSIAVQNCYVLSESMNLDPTIRHNLKFYYRCSLIVLIISMLPKINCYFFILLR